MFMGIGPYSNCGEIDKESRVIGRPGYWVATHRGGSHTGLVSNKRHMSDWVKTEAKRHAERCSHPGCSELGEYRAPRSRNALRSYIWFCLEHVRAYNKAWDYYANMDAADIERHVREDVTWQRPTWPLGSRGGPNSGIKDDFGVYQESVGRADGRRDDERDTPEYKRLQPREREALDVMNLAPPITPEIVRERYKELVKQLHPDSNGGDKRAEERLKLVNHAYSTLKNSPHL